MKRLLMILTVLALLLSAVSCAECADKNINVDNQAYWRKVMQSYRDDDDVHQLLLVRYTGGCGAIVRFYEKLAEDNNCWTLVFEEEDAYVGKWGLGKTKEGDGKTPIGDFGVVTAFGIRSNPGTTIDYIDVTPAIYACDENCEYYNTIVDTEKTGHACKGEEMYKLSPEYNYGLVLDYNADNVRGAGSAIFLHCKGEKYFTGGCVAISEEHMETVLTYADSGMRVIIGND